MKGWWECYLFLRHLVLNHHSSKSSTCGGATLSSLEPHLIVSSINLSENVHNLKDIQSTVTEEERNQEIFRFKKLESEIFLTDADKSIIHGCSSTRDIWDFALTRQEQMKPGVKSNSFVDKHKSVDRLHLNTLMSWWFVAQPVCQSACLRAQCLVFLIFNL